MSVNQIVVIPAFYPDRGLGRTVGRFSEYDVVIAYLSTLCEGLDDDGLTYQVYSEGDLILPHSLVIYAGSGWSSPTAKKRTVNISKTMYGEKSSGVMAGLFYETLSEWGRQYVDYHHMCAEPKKSKENDLLNIPDTISVEIEPFLLNGVNVEEYMKHAPVLGKMLALATIEFVRSRRVANPAAKFFGFCG